MSYLKGLLTSCLVLASVMSWAKAVPISMDKTKVKLPEETVKEPPQSVVRYLISQLHKLWLQDIISCLRSVRMHKYAWLFLSGNKLTILKAFTLKEKHTLYYIHTYYLYYRTLDFIMTAISGKLSISLKKISILEKSFTTQTWKISR